MDKAQRDLGTAVRSGGMRGLGIARRCDGRVWVHTYFDERDSFAVDPEKLRDFAVHVLAILDEARDA